MSRARARARAEAAAAPTVAAPARAAAPQAAPALRGPAEPALPTLGHDFSRIRVRASPNVIQRQAVDEGERDHRDMVRQQMRRDMMREFDQAVEARRRAAQALQFARVQTDCPPASGIRLADVLLQLRGRIEGNTACDDFFRRNIGGNPSQILTRDRSVTFTVTSGLSTSGLTTCGNRTASPGHPVAPATVQIQPSLCTSPHLYRVLLHEMAHVADCETGRPLVTFDAHHTLPDQAADACIGTVAQMLQHRDQARTATGQPEDWNFTAIDLLSLQQRAQTIRFSSDSSWFPAVLQTNLRNTLLYLVVPRTDAARTGGVQANDLFHGHVVVPFNREPAGMVAQRDRWTRDLTDTRARELGTTGSVTAANLPRYRQEIGRLATAATPLLADTVRAPGAAVVYHTYEFPPTGSPEAAIPGGSPRRNFITPLDTNSPRPYSAPDPGSAQSYRERTGSADPQYTHIFQFSFLVDRDGVIHVRPDFRRELSDVTGAPLQERP